MGSSANLSQILSMEGSAGDGSYAHHSKGQQHILHSFITNDLPPLLRLHWPLHECKTAISIADFGCSHGSNTLDLFSFLSQSIPQMFCSSNGSDIPEISYYFNDLPSNDFNSLFKQLLQRMPDNITDKDDLSCFVAASPGSFYGRLLPKGSLHLGVSSVSLNWLSQIPTSLLDKTSSSWNGGHAWISSERPEVAKAYAEQFKKDMKSFLRCRAKELVNGGLLYFTLLGRPEMVPLAIYLEETSCMARWLSSIDFDIAWEEMVSEKLIDEDTRDTFNLPVYYPCVSEIEEVVKDIPELSIVELEYMERVPMLPMQDIERLNEDGRALAMFMCGSFKAVQKPLIEAHIGEHLSHTYFHKLERMLMERCCGERSLWVDFIRAVLKRIS